MGRYRHHGFVDERGGRCIVAEHLVRARMVAAYGCHAPAGDTKDV
jgi:hypothetical protein